METQEIPKKNKHRNLWISMLVLVLCGGFGTTYWYFFMHGIIYSDDARFGGEMVDLAPQISGTLTNVYVNEGDYVKKGEVVFSLYKEASETELAKTEAAMAQLAAALKIAQTQYEKAQHGPRSEEIKIAKAIKEKAEVEAKYAESNYIRTKELYNKHVGSMETLDQAQSVWEKARHNMEEAENRLKLFVAGTRKEDLTLAQENVTLVRMQKAMADVAIKQSKINLGLTTVKAPFDGIVVRRWQDPGNVATTGRAVVTLYNPSTIHIDANIEEKYLNEIRVGDKVDIAVDAYPQLSLTGRVSRVLPITNSLFSLIPSEGVSGTYIKVSQRLPIRVEIDDLPHLAFGPGLSVEVKIYHLPLNRSSLALALDEIHN